MTKKWLLQYRQPLLIGCAVLLFFVLLLAFSGDDAPQPSWAPVQRGPFAVITTETGEVRAVQQVDLKAPMEWRMQLQVVFLATEGTVVQEGDLLVQFDDAELKKRLDLAEDRLLSALAQERKIIAEHDAQTQQLLGDLQTAEYSRDIAQIQKDLMKYEAAAKQQEVELEHQKALLQLAEARTSLESEKIIQQASLHTARLTIANERLELQELKNEIAHLALRAPCRGMLVYNEIGRRDNRKKVSHGDIVNPGEPIVSIPNLDSMQVLLRVNEMDVSRLRSGMRAAVILDAYPNRKFYGKINHIARLAQRERWNSVIKDFEVFIRLDQADSLLKPGMTAKAEITIEKLEDVLYAPLGALYEIEGKPVVFPRKKYPQPLPVSLGQRTEAWVVISHPELQADDWIAWKSPDEKAKRIGYSQDLQNARLNEAYWQRTFGEMSKRGLRYDYHSRQPEAAARSGTADSLSGDGTME